MMVRIYNANQMESVGRRIMTQGLPQAKSTRPLSEITKAKKVLGMWLM
jgi:hypothetical protein